MADPNRKLDTLTDAARTRRLGGEHGAGADAEPANDPRLVALHEALQEPPTAGATPNLVPIVMERIARRAATAGAAPASNGAPRAQAVGLVARLRAALGRIDLGPAVAVGSLAAVLAFALWSAGDVGTAGSLSGAAAGIAAPVLLVVALVALGVGLAAAWLRRR
ncbi:MAG: hypothetical protein IPG72_07860 [Ardenticatenales bacterium]|nr:hypothetical protein [Ardenticatenales bacterium]